MSQLVVIPKTLLGSEIASFLSCPACWQSGFTPNGSLPSPRRGITTAVADKDRRYVVNLWLINNKLNQLIPQQRNKDTRQEDFSSVKCAENVFCQFKGRVFFFFFLYKCVWGLWKKLYSLIGTLSSFIHLLLVHQREAGSWWKGFCRQLIWVMMRRRRGQVRHVSSFFTGFFFSAVLAAVLALHHSLMGLLRLTFDGLLLKMLLKRAHCATANYARNKRLCASRKQNSSFFSH